MTPENESVTIRIRENRQADSALQKGKDMITMNRFYSFDIECKKAALEKHECCFDFMCPFKVKQKTMNCVCAYLQD